MFKIKCNSLKFQWLWGRLRLRVLHTIPAPVCHPVSSCIACQTGICMLTLKMRAAPVVSPISPTTRRFRVHDALDLSEPLLNHATLPPGLTNCILIAHKWDLVVIQLFHRKSVRFFICNLTSQTCVHVYTMCRRPGLCEAYSLYIDRNILMLKANDAYYSLVPISLKRFRSSETSLYTT